jgi:type 1 glutamine amidotransferase
MSSLILLTGGLDHAHDFPAAAAALVELLEDHDVEVVDHPDAVVNRLERADALIVHALRWQMLAPAYEPWRERWAYTTPAATRTAIAEFVAAGGGLVGCHTASICFDDWAGWRDVLGGTWVWGQSSHPPVGPVTVDVTDRTNHPVVAGLPERFELCDEVYGHLDRLPDVQPLAFARCRADDSSQPAVWAHRCGDGRVVYDALGHDVASLRQVDHARLLRQAVLWVTNTG